MDNNTLKTLFELNKEQSLFHRYITNDHISPLLQNFKDTFQIETIGHSVLKAPIYGVKIGYGAKRIFIWSQMHGNESTTTKAIFDVLNTLNSQSDIATRILKACTIYIIPVLNPDGARAYTRINANSIDLNRDAQQRSQPESVVLRNIFDSFKPHYCYNLHGQRTIFSAGNSNKSAVVSFLAPAQDKACTVTANRMIAMEIISYMNSILQKEIPSRVGVYDDAFNLNCVGDTFQSENIPTILFEAGHFPEDYARETTRLFIYMSLLSSLDYISTHTIKGDNYKEYLEIPENQKLFLDIIIRNTKIESNGDVVDIGIQYSERLVSNKIEFIPIVEKIENLSGFFGHKEYDAKGGLVLSDNEKMIELNNEIVFVIVNNEKISLLPK